MAAKGLLCCLVADRCHLRGDAVGGFRRATWRGFQLRSGHRDENHNTLARKGRGKFPKVLICVQSLPALPVC